MELKEAEQLSHARPPAAERERLLREHLAGLRRNFEGHLALIRRVDAIEQALEHLPRDLAAGREQSKEQLDILNVAIDHTLLELRGHDPDAD